MKLSKVIDKIERLNPSTLSPEDLVDEINSLEKNIAIEVLRLEEYQFASLENTDADLLAPEPYGHVYYEYLCARIDYINRDIPSYSVSSSQFNSTYKELEAFCIRTGLTPDTGHTLLDYF